MILFEDIYAATNGGLDVLCHFYKEIDPFNPKKPLKLRSDDKRASAGCYEKDGIWWIHDFGGSDNKNYNALTLVMEKLNLNTKGKAAEWIAQNFAPHLLASASGNNTFAFKPVMKKEAPSSEMRLIKRKSGEFTKAELECLGYKITQKTCDEFGLVPLDGYITKAKGDHSWRIESNDQYPILFYDYGEWGKIYQPYGDLRFMYYGEKPKDFIFGTKTFQEYWKDAVQGKYPMSEEELNAEKERKKQRGANKEADGDDLNDVDRKIKFKHLILCSGPSDALNAYSVGNCEVCWLNSESEPLSDNHLEKLKRICENLYVCFDSDETGLRCARKIALQDLDVKVIEFPEDFSTYSTNKRDSEGNNKPCKDIKDFMVFYKRGQINPHYEFKERLMKLAKPLKFWTETVSEKGRINYDISNACMFKFLAATGFYKMLVGKDSWRYVFVKDKIIDVIPDANIVSKVRMHLVKFISDNPKYYSIGLENMILRNKVLNAESFQNLEERSFNMNSFSRTEEYFFFRNAIIRVTGDNIERVNPSDCPYYILKDKITQHDIILPEKPYYFVNYSEHYKWAESVLQENLNLPSPDPSSISEIRHEIDKMPNYERYSLEISSDFDLIRFIYNTGNIYWKEEREAKLASSELTPKERHIIDLNFINKCTALGYLLSRYKSPSNAKALYCIETSIAEEDEGEHNGGSGKSLFTSFVQHLRNRISVSGQKATNNEFNFLYQNVDFDTDIFHIDDLNSKFDMNLLLPDITGDLQVNPKHRSAFILPFSQSPKLSLTSNHAISRFTGSLRRRIFFCEFSDYYHSANPDKGVKEMSPKIEFGRDFFDDFSEEDYNTFYNFMLQTVSTYLKYGLIDADMENIEKRQKYYAVGTDFIDWADTYFQDRFNMQIDKEDAFCNYKSSLSQRSQSFVKKKTFTKKLQQWCEIRGYIYNPEEIMRYKSETERKRNEIRWQKETFEGKTISVYGFYIGNKDADVFDNM